MAASMTMNALEVAGATSRMSRDSEGDDNKQRRRRREPQNESAKVDADFYNDEAPHQLDELA